MQCGVQNRISLPVAGVDVRAEESERPPAEVEVIGKANGVADPAGLLNPKLKPVVEADVAAGAPTTMNIILKTFC